MGKSVAVFVGTYTEPGYRGKGEGIYSYRLSLETGSLSHARTTSGVANPSYLALDPAGEHLYCVNELQEFEGAASGAAAAFSVDRASLSLARLNARATEGMDPCHIVIGGDSLFALVSNYTSGSVCVLPIGRDGSLGEAAQLLRHRGRGVDEDRQAGPHTHSLTFDAGQRYAFVCDLGTDRLVAYRYDGRARDPLSLAEGSGAAVKPGAGPRHCAFHPSGKFLYLMNELDSTIEALAYRPDTGIVGKLQAVSALPEAGGPPNLGAAIRVSPDGRFLYASNRGHDSIAIFRIDRGTGLLACVGHEGSGGRTPRDFVIDPSGAFLLAANQDSDNVTAFRIDAESGRLSRVASVEVPTPVCVAALMLG